MAPKVITITNQKGGTGKTTLTALLGYALASRGYNVLLLDLDPQAHLSSFFIPVNKLENVDNGVIQLAQRKNFNIYETNLNIKGKLDIIPSGLNYIISTYRGELPSTNAYAIDSRIRTEPAINRTYDFILCDTAPELFAPTIWGLYTADYILIPTNNEELSFAGVRLLIKEVLPEILSESKRAPKVLGIVLVNLVRGLKSNSLNKINDEFKKLITQLPITTRERFYKKPIFNTIVYRYQKLRDLMYRPRRRGVPLFRIVDQLPKLKDNLNVLANELLGRIDSFEGLR